MQCTVLIENEPGPGLVGEHGLSLWISFRKKQYLLDSGATDAFLGNADALGIDLQTAAAAVLSHAHYDHSGGFSGFFSRNTSARVYLQKTARELCYSMYRDKKRYLGIPDGLLEAYADRFVYVDGVKALAEGLWLLPHTTKGLAKRGEAAYMYRETPDGLMPDDFSHEQSLVAETANGLVVYNSCSHGGIETIVREVKDAFPGKPVYAVVGGFHLMTPKGTATMAVSPEAVKAAAKELQALGVQEIYTGHCTGVPAYTILAEAYPGHVHALHTGTAIHFPEGEIKANKNGGEKHV